MIFQAETHPETLFLLNLPQDLHRDREGARRRREVLRVHRPRPHGRLLKRNGAGTRLARRRSRRLQRRLHALQRDPAARAPQLQGGINV